MYLSMPIIVVAGAVILLLGWLAFFRRPEGRDLMAPPRAARPPRPASAIALPRSAPDPAFGPGAPLPPDVETDARALIARGQKINAIKLVRDRTGLGLKEAKDAVEALE